MTSRTASGSAPGSAETRGQAALSGMGMLPPPPQEKPKVAHQEVGVAWTGRGGPAGGLAPDACE